MKCEIVKDLLPIYIDGLTSNESNSEIEDHLKTCQTCKDVHDQMKTEIDVETIELNKENFNPFKKLNKRIFRAVLTTLAVCILITGSYFYFFAIGWKVTSDDMNINYFSSDGGILIEFELTDGNVLNNWSKHTASVASISFTECFSSILDDRGQAPNKFSYGVSKTEPFTDDDYITLYYKDKTETLNLKEIAEELGLQ